MRKKIEDFYLKNFFEQNAFYFYFNTKFYVVIINHM